MNTLEKADKFLQYKFFNVNYLLEINYKVGNLIDLQDDLQDYIANNEPELHQEFMDSTQLDIDDIIVQCSEYYRNYDDLDNYRSFTNTIFYGLFHEFSGEILQDRLDSIFGELEEGEEGEFIDPDKIMKEYNECIFKLAINKLKRNKLVNEGILLKLSMKNCGMF